MTLQGDIPVCMFKSSKCEAIPADEILSAYLETNISEQSDLRNHFLLEIHVLTAWALTLRCYLATDLVSFASFGAEDGELTVRNENDEVLETTREEGSPKGVVHSVEISDDDNIFDTLSSLDQGKAQRTFNPMLLSYFNTVVVYRSAQASAAVREAMIDKLEAQSANERRVDVCLTVSKVRGLLLLTIQASPSRFSLLLAQRLLKTYHQILRQVLTAERTQRVGDIDTLTEEDFSQIRQWNVDVPRRLHKCVHETFEERARQRPDSAAVCSWDMQLTYAELDNLSTKLAHRLSRLGVKPEVFVPYGFEKSAYAVIATLAILKAGGAFVPIDSSHPPSRLRSIVSRVDAKLILASTQTAPALRVLGVSILIVDQALLDSLPEAKHNPYSGVTPKNSAFVLFTSGSTGEPKGLVQEHASVCTVNEAYSVPLHINENSRVLNFAAYTFDVSTVDVFTTLSQGGCVCVPSEEDRLNNITRVIDDFRVNWIDLTPSFAMASIPCLDEIPTLKTLVLAGEEVKREHVAHFVGKVDRVINCYGPAEAGGVLANIYRDALSPPQTIGKPLKNASCWIVDLNNPRKLAPIGAVGELVIEGSTLARGYLKDQQRTDAAFSYHHGWRRHLDHMVEQRFYKTGDLVQYRPDGLTNFIGRRDTQIKLRGQRIELADIEQHLIEDATIRRCLVDFPPSGVYAQRLVGIIEPCLDDEDSLSSTSLTLQLIPKEDLPKSNFSLIRSTKTLAAKVPGYMMPVAWLVITGFPLTDSKKVDRRKVRTWLTNLTFSEDVLASSDIARSALIASGDTIALELSHKISAIIANGNSLIFATLNGRNFDIAAAGIDSIQIVSLSKWIQDTYGIKFSVNKLTRPGLNIERLAQMVQLAPNDGQALDQEVDILAEVDMLAAGFNQPKSSNLRHSQSLHASTNVFLTGSTGFLGVEILRQLLCNPTIDKVAVLVRATSIQHGKERVVAAARRGKWWKTSFDQRLEVWLGDLGRNQFGLDDAQWQQLSGDTSEATRIHAIIHNGALVKWTLAYESLRASNTVSTAKLLNAMADWEFRGRFVYVSGGQALKLGVDDENSMAALGTQLTGYAQTKIVSELLVKRFAMSEGGRGHVVRVVKPSYIVGDAKRGVANPDDYLWRLTKSAIELGTYGRNERNGWLFVSDVATVARTVCQVCSSTDGGTATPVVIKILDGLFIQDFWDVLIKIGYGLKRMEADRWWRLLRLHVGQMGPEHQLWALQDMLTLEKGEIASLVTAPSKEMFARRFEVVQAIRNNMRYLRDAVQYLPPTTQCRYRL